MQPSMNVQPLVPFSCDRTSAAVQRVEVQVSRTAGLLMARYDVVGDISRLRIPYSILAQRRDELWRHTCAELFVAADSQAGYCEFNFSPSTEWAAYRFDDYRRGMRLLDCLPPEIDVLQDTEHLSLQVKCTLPASLSDRPVKIGLTMVIEDEEGQCSYWAVKHPGEKPDFHHRDGFVVEL